MDGLEFLSELKRIAEISGPAVSGCDDIECLKKISDVTTAITKKVVSRRIEVCAKEKSRAGLHEATRDAILASDMDVSDEWVENQATIVVDNLAARRISKTGAHKKFSDERIANLVERGLTRRQIVNQLGASYSTVNAAIKRLKLKVKRDRAESAIARDSMILKMLGEGFTQAEVARRLGVVPQRVSQILKRIRATQEQDLSVSVSKNEDNPSE